MHRWSFVLAAFVPCCLNARRVARIAPNCPSTIRLKLAMRKGQVRWVAKGDPAAQRQFTHAIFGVAA
jgi:hypothetical protein